ncbi:conserved eukaryotic protein [Moniliophthora roreri MCA 2997]|uniref:Conserved eukaryotic protein n=2 Tax=Moniliophthora roreri TaxID=221103 RepID=V2XRA0_MONRO|nr:conserved eukaryotic protein [Moniliophthora roreri MCA 2997]KAI3622627.1 conserved eukaryotic protein [Moniliophthora roreri]
MVKGKGKLKSALQSQQSRFKAKERATHTIEVAKANEDKARGKRNKKIKLDPRSLVSSEKELINAKGKAKAKAGDIPRRPTVPFRPTDTILLVGEGNFSFTRALSACIGELEGSSSSTHPALASLAHLPARNITATAYDSEEECYEKYPDAREIVKELRLKGVEVEFGVDAGKLEVLARNKGKGKGKELRKWDKVVWNFPHAGKGITDQDRNILSNQLLILSFLRSAAKVLKEGPVPDVMASSGKKRKRTDDDDDDDDDDNNNEEEAMENEGVIQRSPSGCRGTVLITLRNVPPYTLWDVAKLAKNPPPPTQGSVPPNPKYTLLRSFAFYRGLWKGYEHRMTKGERAYGQGKTGEGGEDRSWEFCLKD